MASAVEKRCDYLLFVQAKGGGRRWIVPIELKSGTIKAEDLDDIREQLQKGADIGEEWLRDADDRVQLRAIVGHGGVHWQIERLLTRGRYRIRLRGKSAIIEAIRCGGRIGDVLQ